MPLIHFQTQDGVARVTLNRPEKRNALNAEMITEFHQALDEAAKDRSTRVVLILASGQDFCAGLDLLALDQGNQAGPLEHLRSARHLADLLLAIRRHPRPVVAAVRGRALGGGAGIATACDLLLMADTASIGYPEVKFGFVPAIVAALLRRSVSEKRVFELLATGESIPANDALAIGLVNRVFPAEDFLAGVEAYAQGLTKKSASSLTLTKALLYQTDGLALEKAIEAGVQMNALSRTTEDAKKGFAGFLKK